MRWALVAALMLATVCAAAQETVRKGDKEVELTPEGCRIERYTIPSPCMKRDIRVAVVLPPDYDARPEERYPILYTLHGARAPYDTWSQMSPLRRVLRDKPMIVTCFDGDEVGMYIDSRPDSQFTTFFFDEFVPYMDEHYRVNGLRGVTGFSMGGYGAFHYMLTKPDMFASVSLLSSGFRQGRPGPRPVDSPAPPPGEGRDRQGPPRPSRDEQGPPGVVREQPEGQAAGRPRGFSRPPIHDRIVQYVADGVKLPPMMMHCGTEDRGLEPSREFATFLTEQNKIIRERLESQVAGIEDQRERRGKLSELMAEHGLNFMYKESPGGHNWEFWRDASEAVAEFHWKSFQKAAE